MWGHKNQKDPIWYVFERVAYFWQNVNKRAMMALSHSPESVSPQNEFYLLYYYCSNLWPPGWGQFWPQGYHMNRIDIGPNIIVQGQMITALLLLVSGKKNFKVFLLCSYVSNLWPPGRGPIWPHGHHMNNFGRGPLGDATCEISIKALHLLVSEKKNFEVFLLCPYVLNLWTPPRGWASFDPRGIIWTILVEVH